tara:strand:- start:307 stop:528 length:222 start_codon:yes stop_codon:yes gene_type:complete
MGALILDGSVVGERSFVAAGALVKEGFEVPPETLVAGVPAKVIRDLRPEELDRVTQTAHNYIGYVEEYRQGLK